MRPFIPAKDLTYFEQFIERNGLSGSASNSGSTGRQFSWVTNDVEEIWFWIMMMMNMNMVIHSNNNSNYNYNNDVAIETAGTWHHQAAELVQELGRRATIITGDSRETTYLFQQYCYQWLCKRGTRSRFRTRFQSASMSAPVIYC